VITVPVSAAVVVFLLITVASVLVVWLFAGRHMPDAGLPRDTTEHVWRCPICTHVYVQTKRGTISECPECGSMNTEDESEKVDLRD
jgi:hypothetical protein